MHCVLRNVKRCRGRLSTRLEKLVKNDVTRIGNGDEDLREARDAWRDLAAKQPI